MQRARLAALLLVASMLVPAAALAGDGAPPEGGRPAPAKDGKGAGGGGEAKAPAKPAETKPTEAKPATSKPATSKPADPKPAGSGDPSPKDAGKKPAPESPAVMKRTPRSKAEALRILEHTELSFDFDETPVRDAVTHLSLLTGVNMVLGPALLREGDADLLKVSLRLRKVTGRQALELLTDGLNLGIGFESGVVLVTTVKEARGKPVLRLYPIADLAMVIRDFPGPDLMLHPAGAEVKVEETKEHKGAYSDPDDILRLVKDNAGAGTWDDTDVSASTMRDWLLVKQYPDVHAEIAQLLAMVRGAR